MRVIAETQGLRMGRLQALTVLSALVVVALTIVTLGTETVLRPLEAPRPLLASLLVLALLVLSLRRPQAAMLLILWWLPLMGLVRRLFDTLGVFELDPVLAVAPVVAAGMTLLAFHRCKGSIGHSLRTSAPALLAALLGALFAVHAIVGVMPGFETDVGSAFYLLGPILWYFLGRAYLDEAAVRRLLIGSMAIGVACGLLGFYQTFVGFLPYEEEWIARKVDRFPALYVGRFIRPFSTFANPEEWSRYMALVGTASVAFLMGGRRARGRLVLTLAVSAAAIAVSGIRTTVFGFVVSLALVLWLMAKSRVGALVWLGALAAAVASFLWLAPVLSWREVVASRVAWMAFLGHMARGIRAPLQEESFSVRLDIWRHLFIEVVPAHPLGFGPADATESYLVTVFVGTGILGGLLFLGILGALSVHAWRLCRRRGDAILVAAVAALAGITLTSMSGNSLALYSIGPLGWALAGWVSAQPVAERRG